MPASSLSTSSTPVQPGGSQPGTASSVNFGYVAASQHKAVPLDPGEYARVAVSINPGVWDTLEPGTYALHAVLVSLGVRTTAPLTVEVSPEVIARHRKRSARPSSHPADRRQVREQQIERLRAQRSASHALDRIAAAVMAAKTDDEAVAEIGHVLGVDEKHSAAVYESTLRDLRPDDARRDERLEQLIAQRDG
jgi:hypothetical protein